MPTKVHDLADRYQDLKLNLILCSFQMLEHIHSQTKEETVSLIEVLEKQFDQLFTSLDSR